MTTETLKPQRFNWVDYAKGIGIFLVVFGHTIRGLFNSFILAQSPFWLNLNHWIYAFHMPLFFLLSGLFIERSVSKQFLSFLSNRIKVIVYPYFLWSIIQTLIQFFLSKYTNKSVNILDIWTIIYDPIMQFWFLYTLFFISILFVIIHHLKGNLLFFLIFSIVFYLLYCFGFNLGSWGVIYLACRYIIYFAVGACIGSSINLMSKLNKLDNKAIIGIMITGFLGVTLGVGLNLYENKFFIPLWAFLGIFASIALSISLERLNLAKFIQQWGLFSLEIYVAHTIFSAMLRIILQKVFGYADPIPHLILGTLIGIYAPILLALVCKRFGFSYMFTFATR